MKLCYMKYWFVLFNVLIITSCLKDDPEPSNLKINRWVYPHMDYYYLWNETITSEMRPEGDQNPKEYFNTLLNKPTDKWSVMIEDYEAFNQGMAGNPTSMGYEAIYGAFKGTNNVYAIVKFVYPGTPAHNAGLKKGDIIIEVDNTILNTDNYQELFSQDSYTLTLGLYEDGMVSKSDIKLSMTAELLDINPVIKDTVYVINGKQIGYMVITEFLDSVTFAKNVGISALAFKSKNINDLIIDFRYNTGGDLRSALWLGSVLAPVGNTQNNDVFVKLMYNETIQAQIDEDDGSNFTFEYIPEYNIGIDNVYFLTTHYSTASASELVITGLKPYMNVVQVGENTVGKYHGMSVLPHPENYWAILPVTFKYANAENFSDFNEGLVPDVYVEDDLIAGYQFGDTDDPVIAKAIEIATGLPARKHAHENSFKEFDIINSKAQLYKMNVFLK